MHKNHEMSQVRGWRSFLLASTHPLFHSLTAHIYFQTGGLNGKWSGSQRRIYVRPLHIFLRKPEGHPSYPCLQQQLPQLFLPCLPTHNEAACCAQNNVRLWRSENASVLRVCVYILGMTLSWIKSAGCDAATHSSAFEGRAHIQTERRIYTHNICIYLYATVTFRTGSLRKMSLPIFSPRLTFKHSHFFLGIFHLVEIFWVHSFAREQHLSSFWYECKEIL